MLLIPEKLYASIEIPIDGDTWWPVKVEIPIQDITEWMHATGRKYPHGWRLRDYLRWNYRSYDDDGYLEHKFVDYVFRVPEGVPRAGDVQRVLYRHRNDGYDSCAVQVKTGEVYAANIVSLSPTKNAQNVELIFSELVTDKGDWFGAVAERCNEGRWGQLYEENESELFSKNISDEMPHFAEAYYFDQDYDKMVLAMAQKIAWGMKDMDGFHDLSCGDDFEQLFDILYYTDGTDRDDWKDYAEKHGLDPDDDDERWEFYDTCDEFAMARYKIDYGCITEVKVKTGEILRECFYPLYEF